VAAKKQQQTRVRVGRRLVPLADATIGQLQIAALRAFPSSPYQLEIRAEIDRRHARGERAWTPIRRSNMTVPEEGPVEHLKNAAAIIQANLELGEKDALVADDARAVLARIRTALKQLEDRRVNIGLSRHAKRRSVRRGNPALAILGANPRVEDATIASWAKIEYRRPDDPDGKNVIRVHEFRDGFEIGWLSDGTVQLSHPKHPLWTEDDE